MVPGAGEGARQEGILVAADIREAIRVVHLTTLRGEVSAGTAIVHAEEEATAVEGLRMTPLTQVTVVGRLMM